MNEQRVRDLVLQYGWNATAYQLVNPGIAHWFSSRGDAVIGYVRKHRVLVAAGAPVCAEDRLPAVVEEFEKFAANRGECVCYFGAAGRIKDLLDERPGYSTVVLGAQPTWHPSSWNGIIQSHASLRAQLKRATNKGVIVSLWTPGHALENPELRRVLNEWLQTRGLPTLHFMVEPETLSFMADRRVFVAEKDGRVVAFLTLCPIPSRNGWLTEQFPRGRDAPNGTVELLMDAAIRQVALEGADYITMGLVPLSLQGVLPGEDNPAWLRILLARARAHGRRFYNFGGLESFKAKFVPDAWEPIYAISNERRFSLRTLYAIAAAFTQQSPLIAIAYGLGKALQQEWRWAVRGKN